uniref:Uncharacterized protein n=1 Tax=candidate division WOR-3 bacterium TaxID=2052148 RepID=A0A7C4CAW6_UNCW3
MKRTALFAAAVAALVARADTVDFSRYAVVISSFESGPTDASNQADIAGRIIQALASAGYDRDQSVAEWLTAHPQARRRLERLNLLPRQAETRFLSDGTKAVDREYELLGPILRLLLPETGNGRLLGRKACPCCGQPWPEGKEPPAGVRLVPYDDGSADGYTGILIDGRGLRHRPALFPRVVTPEDKEVIGPAFADPELLAADGPLAYFRDRNSALLSDRTGANPLVVRAQAAVGANACDLVISTQDASRIHGSRHLLKLVGECRVGFIVD